jgi:hypothetical protein
VVPRGKPGGKQLSVPSIKNPLVYNELKRVAEELLGIPFVSCHINKNLTCPPHFDRKNKGDSWLISCGDYTGSCLVIEDEIFNTRYNPVCFNGKEKLHWNTDDLIGTKYSIVFYQ